MKPIEPSFRGGLIWNPSTSTTRNDVTQPAKRVLPIRPSHSPLRIGLRSSISPIKPPPNVPHADPCKNNVRNP